ncbi:MAG TPA: bifunctional alpha,alpha-trehalose-phosphate synthase (UDP-forming)/trehalose-phosphatase [bacterium]|nr:bifunctional alpha,alpha-trehalose-phosphate synthase (UDP-forming)/trehalose-phosphatase [bacterium]
MSRLLLVSNRLPVTVEHKKGIDQFRESVGGLATGLSSFYRSYESRWIGWCGLLSDGLDGDHRKALENELHRRYESHPVFLSRRETRLFYSGFCNKTLWPLFHYFSDDVTYDSQQWRSYLRVNKLFAHAVLDVAEPDDRIWIHDYHLMLLPQMIREKLPGAQIGFFLHIPFPSYEIFRLLPWRKEILQGIMGADLIGFHTYDYVRHFTSSVRRLLGHEQTFGQIAHNHRITKVDAFPMGIDFNRFSRTDGDREWIQGIISRIRAGNDCKMILSVDRLDYTKGIPQRLDAFDLFLEKYPEYRGRVTLIMIAVPSRTSVERYQRLKRSVDERVGRINGKYGTIDWMPIWYLYRAMDFNRLIALYKAADAALITPLRDGMNLIAKEFLAAREDDLGVLILSEMAGAATELSEAIIVNPNNREEMADAIVEALSLSEEERKSRNAVMRNRICRYDVTAWAQDFMRHLANTRGIQDALGSRILCGKSRSRLKSNFVKAEKRLIFLDYDGTLVPFASTPEKARPDPSLNTLMENLIANPRNHVVIISGRDRLTLENWLGHLDVGMAAEHGVWVRERQGEWHMIEPLKDDWKDEIRPLLEVYVDRTPGSLIEEKSFSLAWHYRKADPGQGIERARELKETLLGLTANLHLIVAEGARMIEVKHGSIHKGRASLFWTSNDSWDFIMAFGDDWTDEDLFQALPEKAWSIKVGLDFSKAKYYLKNHIDVRELLEELLRTETAA